MLARRGNRRREWSKLQALRFCEGLVGLGLGCWSSAASDGSRSELEGMVVSS